MFLEEHTLFTYNEWAKESNKMSYYKWFCMGVENNYKPW